MRILTFFLAVFLAGLHAGPAAAESAVNNYMLECQGCHAIDGRGSNDTVPTLKDHMAKFLLVPGGREFLVRVPGSAQAPLSDAELADTLNWMLRRFGPAAIAERFPLYTADEVAGLRRTPLVNVGDVRTQLIRALVDPEVEAEQPVAPRP